MAIRPYDRPPGVTVTEIPEKPTNPIIATPDQLCLVGPATGSIPVKELVTLYECSGTVTIANSSKAVTGFGTNFTSALVGKYLNINVTNDPTTNKAYKIAEVVNATTLTLVDAVGASDGVTKSKYTIGTPLTQIVAADTFIAGSQSVYDLDSANAQALNSAYTSNGGYSVNSYTVDRVNKTLAKKNLGLTTSHVGTAALNANISKDATSITAIGNLADFPAPSGTIVIDKEQITYSNVTADTNTTATEIQTVTLNDTPTAGSFDLYYDEQYVTVQYNTSANDLQTALRALSNIGASNVTVALANNVYTITFASSLANKNVPQFVVKNNTLVKNSTSVSATVATTTHGGSAVLTFTVINRGANKTTAEAHSANDVVTAGFVIPNNRSVYIEYNYTPENYYRPVSLSTSSEIEARFGSAYKVDANGNETTEINSPLTLAAKIAIENGARDLILQPLFYSTDDITTNMPTRTQPSNANATSTNGISNTWAKSFRSLQNVENIGVIVAVSGQDSTWNYGTGDAAELGDADQLAILQALQQHIAYMDSEYDQLVIGVVGEDSTSSTTTTTYASRATITSHLQSLQGYSSNGKSYSEQIVYVAQTAFKRPSSIGPNISVDLGGQYAAAAVAGKLVSYKPNISLTRKTLAGFKTVEDASRTKRQKTEDSRNGFLVIEQNPNDGSVLIRHALTANNELWSKSELNAVRSKHAMIRSLRQTIENQVIGQVIADDTAPITLTTIVGSTLRTLQDDGVIVAFDSVQAQIDRFNPTEFGIRFNYRPTFAISYVNLTFSVDLSSGITSLTANEQTTL